MKGLDAEIIEITPEDHLQDEIEQSDEYKERFYSALARINKVMDSVCTTAASVLASSDAGTRKVTVNRGATTVKLPKLSLPHFNGDLTKWTTFWDSYESAVHSNGDLTNVEKFNYLRSLLERTPHDAITGLTLSSANYREAVEILHKRFGNKQMIISKHMELLLNTM